jgi:NAD(P)-dependent dehydrogenase (short-subunit alcohol dehydrogenase family)
MTRRYPFLVCGDEFKAKRVLVTGGTRGVGEAIVRHFQLSGASVATTARAPHYLTVNLPVSLYRRISRHHPARRW